jgi:hypothetical protein
LLGNFLQIIQVKHARVFAEMALSVRVAHWHHEPPRSVEEDVVIHRSVPGFENV